MSVCACVRACVRACKTMCVLFSAYEHVYMPVYPPLSRNDDFLPSIVWFVGADRYPVWRSVFTARVAHCLGSF